MIRYLYCFIFTCFLWHLSAQKIVVVDETSLEPIAGVAIFNLVKTKTDVSSLDGSILISRFQSFERIHFQHLSYRKTSKLKSKINDTIFLTPKSTDLNEIVISASKFEQNKKEVPQKIISLSAKDIKLMNPQTSADLLANSGHVFVQKSQLGGGSPMIRGFSTNRVLITVDGIRLNNAIFRGGNVHNVISINPFNIEKTEIILGSGSVIYGSDAIGGVMNFYTTVPQFSSSEQPEVSTKSNLRYTTANNEKTAQIGMNIGFKKWALHTSMSFSDFGDLKMGRTDIENYLTPFYVTQTNGQDILMPNHNPRLQKFTGFNQFHGAQKIRFKHSKNLTFDFGLHYAITSNIPRYDRLIIHNPDNSLKYAEWDYGPQKWLLANAQLTKLSSKSPFYDKIKSTIAFQNFKESRINRKFESPDRKIRSEVVGAISFNLDLDKLISERLNLSYGTEYLYNKIRSKGISYNIGTNDVIGIASRYPDGSNWTSLASYLSFKYKPKTRLTFQSGLRYNIISIKADLTPNIEFYDIPFLNSNINTSALTGTAGLSWQQNEMFSWKLNATTAFRAPNIDDVGKVFDSQPGYVVVPNNHLKPEYAYGGELGLKINFEGYALVDISTYYTYLDNAMTRDSFSINGQSVIDYDGELSNVQAIQNTSKAKIYGIEAGIQLQLSNTLEITSQYSVTKGSQKNNHNIDLPIRHVAPAFGNMHIIWNKNKIILDGFMNYSGSLAYDSISHELSSHLFAVDSNGNPYAPSWCTLNVRTQYQLNENISFVGAIENILNEGYRPFGSGISGPGTNFIFTISYKN